MKRSHPRPAQVQSGAIVVAAIYLDREMIRRKDELAQVPYDEEVRASEKEDRRLARKKKRLTAWSRVPEHWALFHIFGAVCMTTSCYLCTYWGANCFREFNIEDKVSKRLKGDMGSLIRPAGYVAMVLFVVACSAVYLFHSCWVPAQMSGDDPDDHLDYSDDEEAHDDSGHHHDDRNPSFKRLDIAQTVKAVAGIKQQNSTVELTESKHADDDLPPLHDIDDDPAAYSRPSPASTPRKSVLVDAVHLERNASELKSAKKEARAAKEKLQAEKDKFAQERLRAKRLEAEVTALRRASMGLAPPSVLDPAGPTQDHSPCPSPKQGGEDVDHDPETFV